MGNGERIRGAVTTRLPQLLELCTNLQELTLKKAVVFSLTDFSNANCEYSFSLSAPSMNERKLAKVFVRLHYGRTITNS